MIEAVGGMRRIDATLTSANVPLVDAATGLQGHTVAPSLAPSAVNGVDRFAVEHRVSDPGAVQQFRQLMQPTATTPSVAPVRSPGVLAPGDRILAGLDRQGATMTARWQNIHAMAYRIGPAPSASAMLQVGASMLQMSVEHELIGKVVSLSTRAVDGLTKLS